MDVVQRPLQTAGVLLQRGEVVDTGAWRHAPKLREQRYIATYTGEPITCSVCGRMFVAVEVFKGHVKEHPEVRNWKSATLKKEE